jgi:hypothetical protein
MKYLEMSTDIALGLKPNVRVTQQSVHNIQLSQISCQMEVPMLPCRIYIWTRCSQM